MTKEQVSVAIGRTPTLIGKLEREEFRSPDKPSGISIGDKMIDKLASVLDIDRDELYRAYGKLPRDVLEYLVVTPGALDAVRHMMQPDPDPNRPRQHQQEVEGTSSQTLTVADLDDSGEAFNPLIDMSDLDIGPSVKRRRR